jgi:hypothetical protein
MEAGAAETWDRLEEYVREGRRDGALSAQA